MLDGNGSPFRPGDLSIDDLPLEDNLPIAETQEVEYERDAYKDIEGLSDRANICGNAEDDEESGAVLDRTSTDAIVAGMDNNALWIWRPTTMLIDAICLSPDYSNLVDDDMVTELEVPSVPLP